MGRNNHKCVPSWMIDNRNVGRCLKDQTGACSDSGLRCPCDGVRDFGKMQGKSRVPEWMREKASTGGKRGSKGE